jgi:hypothetical protein
MFYVGLDIHARQITICVLDDKGQVFQRWQVRQIDQMMNRLESLPGRWQVCYEASTGYGMYFELLSKVADHVVVAHPGLLRLIFRFEFPTYMRCVRKNRRCCLGNGRIALGCRLFGVTSAGLLISAQAITPGRATEARWSIRSWPTGSSGRNSDRNRNWRAQ